jgi:hypothetical protein
LSSSPAQTSFSSDSSFSSAFMPLWNHTSPAREKLLS